MTIDNLMQQARQRSASDLILVAGKPPCLYVHGTLQPLNETPLTTEQLSEMLTTFMPKDKQLQLTKTGDVDFAHGLPGIGRVRVNIHQQRGSYAAAMRFINTEIPSLEELNLPPTLYQLAQLPRGLVLVTGSTGSGKSTTLAAMIGYINQNTEKHIITLEDPIEFLFSHQRSVIEQREIGVDSPSFASALRHVVRQKPDVILIGEMRDRETIATALTASETGHLVLGTLHTNSAAQTIERIIDVFDSNHQLQIRVQLANTLQAVICQALLPRQERAGMVPALEILMMTPAIRRTIRDGDTHLIPGMIETGQRFGMCTMDNSLANLVNRSVVSFEAAMAQAMDPEKLQRLTGQQTELATNTTGHHAPCSPDTKLEPVTATSSFKPWH